MKIQTFLQFLIYLILTQQYRISNNSTNSKADLNNDFGREVRPFSHIRKGQRKLFLTKVSK